MFDGLADWMTVPFLHFEHMGRKTKRHGMAHATVYPYRPYACRDGDIIIAVQNNNQWERLCLRVLERPDLHAREDLSSNAQRIDNREAVDEALIPIFAGMSLKEAIERCENGGIAWSIYRQAEALNTHPALRRMPVTLENGETVSLPRPSGRDEAFQPGPLPALGQHTQEIRREFANVPD